MSRKLPAEGLTENKYVMETKHNLVQAVTTKVKKTLVAFSTQACLQTFPSNSGYQVCNSIMDRNVNGES